MKVSKALCAAALLMPLGMAHAQSLTQQPAINAQLAAIDISGFDPGLALMVGYEHPMPMIYKNVSIEGELTASIANPENDYTIAGNRYTEELSYYTVAAFMKYTHPLNQQFSLYGRAGVHYEDVTYDTNFLNYSDSDSSLGRAIGVGINMNMNPNMDLTVGATMYDANADYYSNIKHISAGIKIKL